MKRILVWVAVAIGILLVVVASRSMSIDRPNPTDMTVRPPAAEESTEVTPLSLEPQEADLESETQGLRELVEISDVVALASMGGPRVHVFGVVQEESGAPLPGVSVRFDANNSAWCDTIPSTKDHPDFQTETNDEGYFEFELPVPTARGYLLHVTPRPFYTKQRLRFRNESSNAVPLLSEGERDLGTFLHGDAGTISGRVVDEKGQPVEDARVMRTGPQEGNTVVDAEDGSYGWKHVAVGTYELEVSAYSTVEPQKQQVVVRAGAELHGIDFILTRREFIAGRVIDSDEVPVEGVRVTPWAGAGMHFGGRLTDKDGRFIEYLVSTEPHHLNAVKEGFEPYSGTQYYAPGTRDAVIVMERINSVRFLVVDDVTGRPIERFGLRILQARNPQGNPISSSAHNRSAELDEHANGVLEAPADPRLHDYSIVAPGYAPMRAPVVIDESSSALPKTVTVRMHRGGSITGALVVNGERIPVPEVRLERALVPGHKEKKPGPQLNQEHDYDLDRFAGASRKHSGEQDGNFLIEHLAAGTYKLSIRGRGAGTVEVEAVVREGETTALGEIASHGPGRIEGTILLAGGLPQSGITVQLGTKNFANSSSTLVTPSANSFEFGELDAGMHYLWFSAEEGMLAEGTAIAVHLEAGETKRQQFDLSDRIPARVEIRVTLNGGDTVAAGYTVGLSPRPKGHFKPAFEPTDEYGVSRAQLLAQAGTVIKIYSPKGCLVGQSEPLELEPGRDKLVELDLTPGRLLVRAPITSEIEGYGDLYWKMKDARSAPGRELRLPWTDRGDGFREVDGGWAAAGHYVLSLYESGSLRSKEVEVEVVAGEEAIAVFE